MTRTRVVAAVVVGLVLAGGTAMGQAVNWTEQLQGGPSPRSGHSMAYDAARGVTVLFGGQISPNGLSRETWEWNGASWEVRSVGGPIAQQYAPMAYDAARGVTVLFGYGDRGGDLGETWEWDGAVWRQRTEPGPSRRSWPSMAYDSRRGVCVLFGGTTYGSLSAETWEWDGAVWRQRTEPGPSRRSLSAISYDSGRGVTVMYGGSPGDGSNSFSDTWEWDGRTWTPRGAGPWGVSGHAMAYDSERGVTVMFAGNETWEWNGATWRQRASGLPSHRYGSAMAYDAERGMTVLFGGSSNSEVRNNETWVLGCIGLAVQPASVRACPYAAATFRAEAAGGGPFTYQWRRGGARTPISGANSPTFTIERPTAADEDVYDCVVANGCGSVTSREVRLTVTVADVTCDGFLDFFDYDAFVACFEGAGCPAGTTADFNGDGFTDFMDYADFVAAFEAGV